MNKLSNWMLVLVGLGMTTLALASDDVNSRSRPSFESIDTNKDMLLSSDEIEAFKQSWRENSGEPRRCGSQRPSLFETADTDGDGYVNESEFDAFRERMRRDGGGKRSGCRSSDSGNDSA
jgi:hypothetical protein